MDYRLLIVQMRLEFLHARKDGFELFSYLQMAKESNMLTRRSFNTAGLRIISSHW